MSFARSLPALVRRRPLVALLLALITVIGGYERFDAIGSSTRVSVDERSYLGIANNMSVHRSYAYGSDPRHWAPGTPFLFTAAMKLTGTRTISNAPGGHNPALYAQAIVGTLTILAVFAFAAWLGGPIAGLFAAAFTAAYDPLVLLARSYLAEPLGGLGLVLAVFAVAAVVAGPGRRRRQAVGAGVLLGLAVLARNDMILLFGVLPGLAFLMVWRREGNVRGGLRVGALVVVGALVTVAPWVAYASKEEGRLTPITTAGPSSLWVATYLPAGGRQIILKRQFMAEVCRTFPDREDACGVTATQMDMRLIFELLGRRHPGLTQDEAIQAELDRNIRDYAFGQPLQFGKMLVDKAGRIWGKPWGGGAIGRQESSVAQHRLLLGLSLLGLLAGLIWGGRRRRYVLLAAAALLTVTAMNTIFVSESRMSLRMTPLLFAAGIGGFGAAVRARRGQDEPTFAGVEPSSGPPNGPEDDSVPADGRDERSPAPADADRATPPNDDGADRPSNAHTAQESAADAAVSRHESPDAEPHVER